MSALFAATVVLSAFLLFVVQPMTGKTLLPRFGGAAGVWTTSMLFFQVGLLAGYAYSHWLTTRLGGKMQALVHSLLLGISALAVWFLRLSNAAVTDGDPIAAILLVLTLHLGLPYFLLATTSPLVQYWYHGAIPGGMPYRLFAVSNAASLGGLLAYPALIEPWLPLWLQWNVWTAGYGLFAVLGIATAMKSGGAMRARADAGFEWREALLWLLLAAAPCALWLSVAHHMSQNIAPLPLLWVLPLSLYLVSFVLTFESCRWYRPQRFRLLMPLAIGLLLLGIRFRGWSKGIVLPLAAMSAGLLLCCVFCHGELARRKPEAARLTMFYIVIALGGALGGFFVSVMAPLLFRDFWEFPIATVACFLLALALLYGFTSWKLHLRLVLVGTLAFVFAARFEGAGSFKLRNFYGVLEVRESGEGAGAWRGLLHGGILHGVQFREPALKRIATAYYGERSGVGMEMLRPAAGPRRIGAVGLGIGVIATYARPGDVIRFYEINPQVVEVATRYFDFLRESRGTVEVVVGDARISLSGETPQGFDLLVVDAFSGDAIPVHLLTREAFELYVRHLKPEGALAVHVTNRYLRLSPQVIAIAESLGWKATVIRNPAEPERGIEAASWVIIQGRRQIATGPTKIWTDQYSNLLQVIQ